MKWKKDHKLPNTKSSHQPNKKNRFKSATVHHEPNEPPYTTLASSSNFQPIPDIHVINSNYHNMPQYPVIDPVLQRGVSFDHGDVSQFPHDSFLHPFMDASKEMHSNHLQPRSEFSYKNFPLGGDGGIRNAVSLGEEFFVYKV